MANVKTFAMAAAVVIASVASAQAQTALRTDAGATTTRTEYYALAGTLATRPADQERAIEPAAGSQSTTCGFSVVSSCAQ